MDSSKRMPNAPDSPAAIAEEKHTLSSDNTAPRIIAVLHVHGMGEQQRYGTMAAAASEIHQALTEDVYAHPCSAKGAIIDGVERDGHDGSLAGCDPACNCTEAQFIEQRIAPNPRENPKEKLTAKTDRKEGERLKWEPPGAIGKWTVRAVENPVRFYRIEDSVYKTQVLGYDPPPGSGADPLEIHVMETYWAPEATGMTFWSTFAWLHKAWLALFRNVWPLSRPINIARVNGVDATRSYSWNLQAFKSIIKMLATMWVLIVIATGFILLGLSHATSFIEQLSKLKGRELTDAVAALIHVPSHVSFMGLRGGTVPDWLFVTLVGLTLLLSLLLISNVLRSPLPYAPYFFHVLGRRILTPKWLVWLVIAADLLVHIFLWFAIWQSRHELLNYSITNLEIENSGQMKAVYAISFILITFFLHLSYWLKLLKLQRTGQHPVHVLILTVLFFLASGLALYAFFVSTSIAALGMASYVLFFVLAWRWLNYYLARWFGDVALFTTQDENSPLYAKRITITHCMLRQLDYVFGTNLHNDPNSSASWDPASVDDKGEPVSPEVIIYGHSLGCIVSYAGLCSYFRRIFESAQGRDEFVQATGRFKAFVTTGCHLDIVEYLFDPGSTENRYYDTLRVFGRYAVPPAGSAQNQWQPLNGVFWLNIWNWWDVFSSKLFQYGDVVSARVAGQFPLACHSYYMQIPRARGLLRHALLMENRPPVVPGGPVQSPIVPLSRKLKSATADALKKLDEDKGAGFMPPAPLPRTDDSDEEEIRQ